MPGYDSLLIYTCLEIKRIQFHPSFPIRVFHQPGGSPMKAVYITEHGGTDKLVYGDRPEPEVAPGEIMVRVRASALNHLDLNLREGKSYNGPLPRTLGCDIAGEVTAISPSTNTSLQVGDRVILNNRVINWHNC